MTSKITYFLCGIVIGVGMMLALNDHNQNAGIVIGGCGFLILVLLIVNEIIDS